MDKTCGKTLACARFVSAVLSSAQCKISSLQETAWRFVVATSQTAVRFSSRQVSKLPRFRKMGSKKTRPCRSREGHFRPHVQAHISVAPSSFWCASLEPRASLVVSFMVWGPVWLGKRRASKRVLWAAECRQKAMPRKVHWEFFVSVVPFHALNQRGFFYKWKIIRA